MVDVNRICFQGRTGIGSLFVGKIRIHFLWRLDPDPQPWLSACKPPETSSQPKIINQDYLFFPVRTKLFRHQKPEKKFFLGIFFSVGIFFELQKKFFFICSPALIISKQFQPIYPVCACEVCGVHCVMIGQCILRAHVRFICQ